jgi:hypothetical protein
MASKRRKRGPRLLPVWVSRALVVLGAWYLAMRPLAGGTWRIYVIGVVLAGAYAAWARRAYRMTVVERTEETVVMRLERVPSPLSRRRRAVAVGLVVAVLVVPLLVAYAFLPPRARSDSGAPPHMNDWRSLSVIEKPSGDSRVEPRYERVVAALGASAEVRCWSVADWRKREEEWGNWRGRPLGEWGAYTNTGPDGGTRIQLSPSICGMLDRLAFQDIPADQDPWPDALAFSVGALAHEAQHARGISDETKAECYGMQSIVSTAEALGRSGAEGRYLASLYWRTTYLKRDEKYRSDDCRDGGPYDLRPETHVWP